jgi:hypothetical protein
MRGEFLLTHTLFAAIFISMLILSVTATVVHECSAHVLSAAVTVSLLQL